MLKVAGGAGGGGNGTVTQINTGTGLTGGPITGNGTISLANTTVTAASYGNASTVGSFTVDAQGRITSASNSTIAISVAAVSGAVPNTVNVLTSGLLSGGGALTGNVTVSLTSVPSGNVTGLGTMATQNSNNVTITGGSINVQSVNLTSTTSSTATFATSSLPLVPAGYIQVDLNGTVVKVPYYAV
jgi:hypothetical protein